MAITVFASFTLLHANEHAFGVEVADADLYGFGNAQTGSVTKHQGGAVFQAPHMMEEKFYLFGAEHDW
jgi:hypothetical protein